MRSRAFPFCVPVCCLILVGCGRSDVPELGGVSGTITVDGEPLADATVMFQPERGRPSFSVTDASGNYRMEYVANEPGVLLGRNTVVITTQKIDDSGRVVVREWLPKRYHEETELSAEIVPGDNDVDFDLTLKED
jgi:hypothetical protein